jgi:thiol-disulfide isomerase/thioredoxin
LNAVSGRSLLAFLAVLAVLGLLGYGLLSKGSSGVELGSAVPTGELPALEGGGSGSVADYRGRWVLVNFWASWCGPCRQEMPLLENIYKKYNKMGFTLIGVNVEPDSKDAEGFLKGLQAPVSFPVIYDKDSTVSKAYDVQGMPSTVIIDRKGNIRVLHRGYKPGDENEYLDSIRTLVRE